MHILLFHDSALLILVVNKIFTSFSQVFFSCTFVLVQCGKFEKKLPKTLSLMFGVKVSFFVKLNKKMNYQFSLKSNIILSFIGLFQHKLKKGKLDVISA